MVRLGFYAGVEYKGKLYFSAMTHNGFYEMNLNTKKVTYLASFSKECMSYTLHRTAFVYGHYGWFVPQRGRYIVKVDLETLDMKYYDVFLEADVEKRNLAFIAAIKIDENRICVIPREINDIVIIDMKNSSIEKLENVLDREKELAMDGLMDGNSLYVFFKYGSYYAKIDLSTGKREDFEMDVLVWSVLKHKNQIWVITGESKKMVCYDLEKEKVVNEFILDKNTKYLGMVQVENKIMGLPFCAPSFLYVDTETKEIYKEIPKQIKLPNYSNKTMQVDSGDGYYFSIGEVGVFAEYCNGKMKYCNIEMDTKEFFEELAKDVVSSTDWNIFYEVLDTIGMERIIGVDGLFYLMKYLENKYDNKVGSNGRMIWKSL